MKIAISGSNGYIAGNLIPVLVAAGHVIIRINRMALADVDALSEQITGTDAVINFAGAPIFSQWTSAKKKEILESRVISTRNLVKTINMLPEEKRPKLFISSSAIGIYKSNYNHTEESRAFADNFVGNVVKNWENASLDLSSSTRKVIFRIGLVLGSGAKTMKNLIPLFKIGLGGKIGKGDQPFPFIHINDVIDAIVWGISNKNANGIYNLVAPQMIDNRQFTKALAKAVKRPAIFTVPAFALKMILGETSSLLLQNPMVIPEKLTQQGFRFEFPDIESCLEQITK